MKPFLVAMLLVACGRSGFDVLPGDGNGNGNGSADGNNTGDGGLDAQLNFTAAFTSFNGVGAPAPRRSSGAALEPGSQERLWMYGGYDGTFLSDMHWYVPMTNTWFTPGTTGTSPGQRERHALTWDPVGNALVIFGGQNRPTIQLVHYDTLHVYAGGAYSEIPKAGNWPGARKDATLLWIPHLSKFLLYGGSDGAMANNHLGDLWLLTLNAGAATGTWQLLTPGGVAAPRRGAACVVYDAAAHRLIVYGGETAEGVDVNTTYQYLLDSNQWQLDSTTGTPPQGRSFGQCAWDPTIGRLVFYGGQFAGGNPVDGYAIYDPDAHAWSSPPMASLAVGARADGGAVYSAELGGLLWYGGRTAVTTYTSELVLMKLLAQ